MKSTQEEIVNYYDVFYAESDFIYYDEKRTIKFLRTIADYCNLKENDKILDVGCGTGYYTNLYNKMGFQSIGIDISKTAINKAKEKYGVSNYETMDATRLTYPKSSFNMIFLYGCSVLNRVDPNEINKYLDYFIDFVKKGGYLVYIGGTDFSNDYSGGTEWFNHKWRDIKRINTKKDAIKFGPFLTHFRLVSFLGKKGFSGFIKFFLKVPFLKFKRMDIIFIKKG